MRLDLRHNTCHNIILVLCDNKRSVHLSSSILLLFQRLAQFYCCVYKLCRICLRLLFYMYLHFQFRELLFHLSATGLFYFFCYCIYLYIMKRLVKNEELGQIFYYAFVNDQWKKKKGRGQNGF